VDVDAPPPLLGRTVGILQTRHAHELAALVERYGGVPLAAPCMREVRAGDDEELRGRIRALVAEPAGVFVFQTGVGTTALFELAAEAGLDGALAEAVLGALVVARGPKPQAVLLKRGLRVDRRTESPHTTDELLRVLEDVALEGRRVALQHYGSPNERLAAHLRARAAEVIELSSYRWALPDDVAPVVRFLDELRRGRVAITAFTSASQVENLFLVAEDGGLAAELPAWLNERTVTAAIGPACAAALRQRGVAVAIQPEQPKMAPFVRAIAEHVPSPTVNLEREEEQGLQHLRRAAEEASDPGRLLPGEAPDSEQEDEIELWVEVYTELLEYKDRLLKVTRESLARMRDEPARREVVETDAVVIEAERARFVRRLDFWRSRQPGRS
jgi:uroporphyrinogen-III synthase